MSPNARPMRPLLAGFLAFFGSYGGLVLSGSYIKWLNAQMRNNTGSEVLLFGFIPVSGQTISPGETLMLYVVLGVLGGLIGFASERFVFESSRRWRQRFERMAPQERMAIVLGVVVGLIITALLHLILRPPVGITILGGIALVYVSLAAFDGMKDQIRIYFPEPTGVRSGSARPHGRPKLMDTNVIIDGRIADVCRAGFVEDPIYLPGFVLEELQQIADSADSLKRARGRRGLEILNGMQKEMDLQVPEFMDDDPSMDVDGRLVRAAKEVGGVIITNDYNLNRVAGIQGVDVLNINELANALKPVVLPGEELTVTVIKEGKEKEQGIGYLDDGTMIVIEGARRLIGETLTTIVTSVLQTVQGKMIFARLKEPGEQEANDKNFRNYTGGRQRH